MLAKLLDFNEKQNFTDQNGKSLGCFKADLLKTTTFMSKYVGSDVNLCIRDTYLFSLCFIAALIHKKNIIIFASEENTHWASDSSLKPLTDKVWSQIRTEPLYELGQIDYEYNGTIAFYTSGSTGEPKKLIKSLDCLFDEVKDLEAQFGNQVEQTHIVSTVSHGHIYGFLFKVLWPLVFQRTIVNTNCFFPESLQALDLDLDYTLITSPAFLKRLQSEFEFNLKLKSIFSSGGALSFEAAECAQACFGIFPTEVFGSTETGGVAYRNRGCESDTAWTFFNSVTGSVDNSGCLKVLSPFFEEAESKMSDQVEFISKDSFVLKGRVDRIAKIEEKRVSLAELEQRLKLHPLVLDCAVTVLEVGLRQQTAAVVVLAEQSVSSRFNLNKKIRTYLSDFFELTTVPKRFRYVSELPVNSQGKVLDKSIKGLFDEN